MEKKKIPWASPHFWGNECRYVEDTLKSTWISGGTYVERLEQEFAQYCWIPYAISASNGTTALHMAYLAQGIGAGDEVIVPGFGFMAAANVALHVGAKPVFADVSADSWCVTAESMERHITSRTKAIVPIHTYGNASDMDPIVDLAKQVGVSVIEDAAEALGSKYKGRHVGTIAPVGIYSFQATKTITTGEGGAAVTSSIALRDKMNLFRNHGMSHKRYWHEVAGHNFRLTNIQAALGCAQLEKINTIIAERNRVYRTYLKRLENVEGVVLQSFSTDVNPVVWAVAVKLERAAFPQGRDAVIDQLSLDGIETRPGFYSPNTMPHIYENAYLPVCTELCEQVLSLPSSPTLTDEEIEYVCIRFKACRK